MQWEDQVKGHTAFMLSAGILMLSVTLPFWCKESENKMKFVLRDSWCFCVYSRQSSDPGIKEVTCS